MYVAYKDNGTYQLKVSRIGAGVECTLAEDLSCVLCIDVG